LRPTLEFLGKDKVAQEMRRDVKKLHESAAVAEYCHAGLNILFPTA
jgi:hypothetical protein